MDTFPLAQISDLWLVLGGGLVSVLLLGIAIRAGRGIGRRPLAPPPTPSPRPPLPPPYLENAPQIVVHPDDGWFRTDPPPFVQRIRVPAAAQQFQVGARIVQGSRYLSSGPRSNRVSYRIGLAGEDAVVESLRRSLTPQWTIFRNLLVGRGGDIDIVLQGPGGVWVIEVKAYGGSLRVQNGTWYRKKPWGWTRLKRGPGFQARQNTARLRRALEQAGCLKVFMTTVVILARPVTLDITSTTTTVWLLSDLPRIARNLQQLGRPVASDSAVQQTLHWIVQQSRLRD